MSINIVQLSAVEIEAFKDQIVHVYRGAFSGPPYHKEELDALAFTETLGRHAQRRGFRCLIAREQGGARIVGFAYGYTGVSGQWWHDLVVKGMGRAMAQQWMSNAFELAELAVLPSMQGQGIGSQLHDLLMRDLPHRTAVLSTYQEETAALRLYRKRGWISLLQHFQFPGYTIPYQIMGLAL